MADLNQIISLGIGTPADIPHFILVGLSPGIATTNGVLSQDIGNFTLTATGTLDIAGVLSASIGTFSLTAAGSQPVAAQTVYDVGPLDGPHVVDCTVTVGQLLTFTLARGARDA